MALPSSGPLSIGDIRTELGSGSGSLRALSALASFSTPDAISEFYGYNAAIATVEVYNSSYDIYITSIAVNGVTVTGFTTVNPGTIRQFTTGVGSSKTVSFSHSYSTFGGSVTLTDSNLTSTCNNADAQGGSFSVTGVNITAAQGIYVDVTDFSC